MGKKYIIELEEPEMFDERKYYRCSQMPWWAVSEKIVENLTPYTAPDLEQVRKEAYQKGYETAKQECEDCPKQAYTDALKMETYQKGLSDAWEAARKLFSEMSEKVIEELFPNEWQNGFRGLINMNPAEAIEKIRQYEQEKEGKIQIGDEVENTQTGVKFIVTHLWENNRGEQGVSGFNRECSAFSTALSLVVKTGRNFPEIAEVLQKMKE